MLIRTITWLCPSLALNSCVIALQESLLNEELRRLRAAETTLHRCQLPVASLGDQSLL
jgi:hypothetical protein